MSPRLLMLAALATVSSSVSALEVIGEAPYLENRYRAVWRSTPLPNVLKDLEKVTAPIVPSTGITDAKDQQVTLIDEDKERLRDTLERLERTQDLHFTAEPLRLFVETWTDFRDRKRRLVNLALRDYGLFIDVRDFPAPDIGYSTATISSGGGGFSLFASGAGDHSAGRGPDPGEVVNWLRTIATDAPASLRGNGNVHLQVTDEEDAAIRAALTEVQTRSLRRSAWRVSFGTVPAGQTLPTGMVTSTEAEAVRLRLQGTRTLTLAGLNGQRVNAIATRQQSLIEDLDVVNYQFDPRTATLLTGVGADLRAHIGAQFIHLTYRLSWVDPQETQVTALTNPARLTAASSTTTTTTTTTEPPKEPPKPPAKDGEKKDEPKQPEPPKKEQVTTTTVSNDGGDVRPGVSVTMTRPVLWTWKPRGETMLPKDRALILATEHPAGTAVMVLEAQP